MLHEPDVRICACQDQLGNLASKMSGEHAQQAQQVDTDIHMTARRDPQEETCPNQNARRGPAATDCTLVSSLGAFKSAQDVTQGGKLLRGTDACFYPWCSKDLRQWPYDAHLQLVAQWTAIWNIEMVGPQPSLP